jgi:hypothetical protein
MNCKELRQQLLVDPSCEDAACLGHVRACPQCARARDEARRFEEALRKALADELGADGDQIRVPPGPALSRRSIAFLALPLVLTVLWLGPRSDTDPVSGEDAAGVIIGHIRAEQEHLLAAGVVPRESLLLLFEALGGRVDRSLGSVRFAERCVIGREDGIHLVLSGQRGAVTALFMPGEDTDGPQDIAGGGLKGYLLPAGSGSLAVVGEPGEALEPIARRLLEAAHWPGRD